MELWHDEKVEVDEEMHKRRVYRLKKDPSQLFLRARELAKVSHQIAPHAQFVFYAPCS